MKKIYRYLAAIGLLLAAAACNIPGTIPSSPVVEIQAPQTGDQVPVGEPTVISVVATDPSGSGIARVEVFIDGTSLRSLEAPSGPEDLFDAAVTWIPDQEGEVIISAIAYRSDGSPSPAASIRVMVVGVSVAESTLTDDAPTSEAGEEETDTPATDTPDEPSLIQGRIVQDANIRQGPGPACTIIGGVKTSQMINLLEYSADRRWIKTDYGGKIGWIYASSVAPEGNTSLIPIGTRQGCRGCGDNVCRDSETCSACAEDCGTCVPPTPTPTPTRTPIPTATSTITQTPIRTATVTNTTVPTATATTAPSATTAATTEPAPTATQEPTTPAATAETPPTP